MLGKGLNLVETTNGLIEEFDVFLHSRIFKEVIGEGYQAQIMGLNEYMREKMFEIQIQYFNPDGTPFEGHDDEYVIALNNCSSYNEELVDLVTDRDVQESLGWWSDVEPKFVMPRITNPTSAKDILNRTKAIVRLDLASN